MSPSLSPIMRSLRVLTMMASLAMLAVTTARADSDTPLEKQMQILARGMRQLSTGVADPAKQQENIALLESLRKAVADSKSLDPQKIATVKAADRDAFLEAYRNELDKLTQIFTDSEAALKAGSYDQAKSLLNGVAPVKKEGHSRFKQD